VRQPRGPVREMLRRPDRRQQTDEQNERETSQDRKRHTGRMAELRAMSWVLTQRQNFYAARGVTSSAKGISSTHASATSVDNRGSASPRIASRTVE
jgi:hypothetical protein